MSSDSLTFNRHMASYNIVQTWQTCFTCVWGFCEMCEQECMARGVTPLHVHRTSVSPSFGPSICPLKLYRSYIIHALGIISLPVGLTPPNKVPILYTLKRSNSTSFISAFEHRLLFVSIFFLKIPISAIQKSKEICGFIFLRLDSETRHLRQPSSAILCIKKSKR